ncbi:hypothetical protein ACLF3G_28030 [Falsiroseomonas sp. HC035]|uniref:hypothetical protein n=1 Tax=Falsiroseomonas sp. HC035 TaxID=3390999 RepID=UPI003D31BB6A
MISHERRILVPGWTPDASPKGYGHSGSNQHAPDEHALEPLLREGLTFMAGLWCNFGAGHDPAMRS